MEQEQIFLLVYFKIMGLYLRHFVTMCAYSYHTKTHCQIGTSSVKK